MNIEHLEDKMIAALEGELSATEYNALMDTIETDKELGLLWKSYESMYSDLNKLEMVQVCPESKSKFTEFLDKEIRATQSGKSPSSSKIISLVDWRRLSAIAAIFIGAIFIWNMGEGSLDNGGTLGNEKTTFAQAMQGSSSTEKIKVIRVSYDDNNLEIDNETIKLLFDVLRKDESSNVRLAVVESLSNYIDRSDVRAALLRSLDKEPDGFVKLAIIKSLSSRFNNEIENKFEGIVNDKANEKFIIDEVQKELFRHGSVQI